MDIQHRDHFRLLDQNDLANINLGKSLWHASLDHLSDQNKNKRALVSFIDDLGTNLVDGRGFIIMGPPGTGKTSLAAILAKATVAFNHTYTQLTNRARLISIPDVVGIYQSGDWQDREELLEYTEECDLVIFDNLGLEWGTQFSSNAVNNVILPRLSAGGSCVVTTTLTKEELASRYSASLLNSLGAKCNYLFTAPPGAKASKGGKA